MSDELRKVHSSKEIYNCESHFKLSTMMMSRANVGPRRFDAIDFNPGVSILPIDDDLNVYLNYELKTAHNEYSLECCGGGIDGDETPLQAAQKELREEQGILADRRQQGKTIKVIKNFVRSHHTLFMAKSLHFQEQELEPTENIVVKKYSLHHAYELMRQGKIDDAYSCNLIYEAYIHYILQK